MRLLDRIRMAWTMLLGRSSAGTSLDDELQFHLEQQIAENITAGMSPEAARHAALRLFGNPTVLRDQTISMWRWSSMEAITRDLRYSVRALLRTPGFSAIAVAVMALGIGAAVSLFTVLSSVMLKPLPFRDPAKLVSLYEHFRSSTAGSRNTLSAGDFRDWHAQTHGFQDMAAYRGIGFNLTGDHQELPEVVEGGAATANFFPLLGVQPALGRTFTADEDQLSGNRAVMLTWALYQRRFAGDPSIVGKTIRLDQNPYVVIGVLPDWFVFPSAKEMLWTSWTQSFKTQEALDQHDNHQTMTIARLKDGVSREAATREVAALQLRIHEANGMRPVAEEAFSLPLIEDLTRDVKTPLMVLLSAVGCLLLIACLNLSNLLVARSASRRKESAIRGALGGSRLTLIRQQMMESLVLCGAGGLLGLALSFAATRWLATHWKALPRAEAIHVDGTILAFAIGLVVVSALLAGLVPAISSTGKSVLGALQDSSRSVGGGSARASLRKTLLTAEIALTVMLLLGAGLLFKSFLHLRSTDLGCTTDHILTMRYGLPAKQYDTPEKVTAFNEALTEKMNRLPGIRAASLVSTPPAGGWDGDNVFTITEKPAPTYSLQYDALVRTADPTYFTTLQIPLLRGRFFTPQERLSHDGFVIVSKRFAEEYFKGEDALGKHLRMPSHNGQVFEIVGVVGDTLWRVSQPIKATFYFPLLAGSGDSRNLAIVARTDGDPLAMALPIQKIISSMDPGLPVRDVNTLQQLVGKSTTDQSFLASLVLAFAVLSLLLAAIGLYGVLSYLVTQRVAEIGIRIALGAQRGQVLRLILIDGLRPVIVGLAIGIAGSLATGALIRSLLYGTSPYDPAVFAVIVAGLLAVTVAAAMVPALNASRIDPMVALRMD